MPSERILGEVGWMVGTTLELTAEPHSAPSLDERFTQMATLTATEFANKVCDYLSDKRDRWINSPVILRYLGLPSVEHNTGRALLKKLRRLGVLEMRERGGRFDWKLAVSEWDRENPFKTKVASPAGF